MITTICTIIGSVICFATAIFGVTIFGALSLGILRGFWN